ncbi:MAG: class I SAM-dependent methyltransferase [Acidimicrobiia bacterium]|nr:class I SAM-dependent methyltransferase [Acidimicrobiia bacterium]
MKAHDLVDRTVLEIGCGKGEFLVMMVEAGIGKGIGIDPGVHPERIAPALADRVDWIADFYSEEYAHLDADAVVCRHTLEHIPDVLGFMSMLRTAIGDRPGTAVLFELPDVLRVLEEVAFWDVYYEHCSYFTLGSLARLFRRAGFEVHDLDVDYDGQYLLLEASPSTTPAPGPPRDRRRSGRRRRGRPPLRAGIRGSGVVVARSLASRTGPRWSHGDLGWGVQGCVLSHQPRRWRRPRAGPGRRRHQPAQARFPHGRDGPRGGRTGVAAPRIHPRWSWR